MSSPRFETNTGLIYKFAKSKNERALADLLASGICIDAQQGAETASQLIASETPVDLEALELLIKMGASLNRIVRGLAFAGHFSLVNNFLARGATLNDAVEGAARGNHRQEVERLIRNRASLHRAVYGAAMGNHVALAEHLIDLGASLNEAIKGAAFAGNFPYVKNLIRRGAAIIPALWGAAYGNQPELVKYLTKYLTKHQGVLPEIAEEHVIAGTIYGGHGSTFSAKLIKKAVWSAACGGHSELLEFLLDQNEGSLADAIEGAAYGGHFALVEKLFQRATPLNRSALLNKAILGFAFGGHFAQVENYILQVPAAGFIIALNHAANKAACGGYVREMKDFLRRGANLNITLGGAACGGYFRIMEDLLYNEEGASLPLAAKGAAQNLPSKQLALRLLAFLPNPLRTNFAKEVTQKQYTRYNMVELLPAANRITSLMQTRQLSVDQSLAWDNNPDLQNLLALCRLDSCLSKSLPDDFYYLIALFLSSFLSNDPKKAETLFIKMQLDVRKLALSINFKKEENNSTPTLFKSKRQKFLAKRQKFLAHCEKANSEAALDQTIKAEIRSLSSPEDADYLRLLKNH